MTTTTTLAANTWVGDPIHSDISFKVRHMTDVRDFDGATFTLVGELISRSSSRPADRTRDEPARSVPRP